MNSETCGGWCLAAAIWGLATVTWGYVAAWLLSMDNWSPALDTLRGLF